MNPAPELLPTWLPWLCLAPALAVALRLLATAPWHLLRLNGLVPVFVAAIGVVTALWTMTAGVRPGLDLHLLGSMALMLIFGWRLAVLAGSVALLALVALGRLDPAAWGLGVLQLAVLPVAVAHWTAQLVRRWLPAHLFVYVLATAFFGAMLPLAAAILVTAAVLLGLGVYPLSVLTHDYLIMLPLVLFPEGFINGLVMTMLVVFKPEWVRSFDDRDYLHGK